MRGVGVERGGGGRGGEEWRGVKCEREVWRGWRGEHLTEERLRMRYFTQRLISKSNRLVDVVVSYMMYQW